MVYNRIRYTVCIYFLHYNEFDREKNSIRSVRSGRAASEVHIIYVRILRINVRFFSIIINIVSCLRVKTDVTVTLCQR